MDPPQAVALGKLLDNSANFFIKVSQYSDDLAKLRTDTIDILKKAKRMGKVVCDIRDAGGDASAVLNHMEEFKRAKQVELGQRIAELTSRFEVLSLACGTPASSSDMPLIPAAQLAAKQFHAMTVADGDVVPNPHHKADDTMYMVYSLCGCEAESEYTSVFAVHGDNICRVQPFGGKCQHSDECYCTHKCEPATNTATSSSGNTRYSWSDTSITLDKDGKYVCGTETFGCGKKPSTRCVKTTWIH